MNTNLIFEIAFGILLAGGIRELVDALFEYEGFLTLILWPVKVACKTVWWTVKLPFKLLGMVFRDGMFLARFTYRVIAGDSVYSRFGMAETDEKRQEQETQKN